MARLGAVLVLSAVLVGCGAGSSHPDGGAADGGEAGAAPTVTTTRYQITVDQTPLLSLPASCYLSGTPPSTQPDATRTLAETWDLVVASTGEQFLLIDGQSSFALGDARPVLFGNVLTAESGTFPAQVRVERTLPNPAAADPNFSEPTTLSTQVELASSANGLSGVLHLSSSYACTSCSNNNGRVSCAADLPFTGTEVPTVPAPEPTTGSSWRLALDLNPLATLPASCFANNAQPMKKLVLTNDRLENDIQLWGAGNAFYLQPQPATFALGDADPVSLERVIRGGNGRFSGSIKDRQLPDPSAANPNFSSATLRQATFTMGSGGAVVTGTLELRSEYGCISCLNNNGKVAVCAASLPFTAIRGGRPLTSAPTYAGRVYRVAIDDSPLQNLPPSCYANDSIPLTKREYTNLELPGLFTIRGAGDSAVMDISPSTYALGDAAPVSFPTLRAVGGTGFYEEETVTTSTATEHRKLSVTMGTTEQLQSGALQVLSTYDCNGCSTTKPSCSAQMQINSGVQ